MVGDAFRVFAQRRLRLLLLLGGTGRLASLGTLNVGVGAVRAALWYENEETEIRTSLRACYEVGDGGLTKPCSEETRLSGVPSFFKPSCSEGL